MNLAAEPDQVSADSEGRMNCEAATEWSQFQKVLNELDVGVNGNCKEFQKDASTQMDTNGNRADEIRRRLGVINSNEERAELLGKISPYEAFVTSALSCVTLDEECSLHVAC